MAVWHFTLALLPQQWLDAGGVVDALYSNYGYDTSAAWVVGDLEATQRRIGSILPFVESSSEPLLVWGAEETDEIWLLSDNGRVQHLRIRFDMRRPNMPMFDHVVSAAEDLRLAILEVGRRRIVPRDVNALVQAAAASRAAGVAAGLGASMDLTPQSEATWLQGLTPADRVRFLVRLAHNLTITARVRSLPKNFEQLRNLNEIQHRILGYVCHAVGPDEDPAWLPIVAGYVLEPNDQGLRKALRRDWHEAREQYLGRGP